jgi:CheY-like chemotaxis protein
MMNDKKILIVDDSLVFLTAVSKLLQAKGYQVLTAEDGAAALSAVRREKIDLILLDINFPPDVAHGGAVNWDGFRIMAWLRRIDEAKGVPIIVVTSGDPAKDKSRCAAPEVIGCFRKPVDHEKLLATIRKALEAQTAEEPSVAKSPGARKILFVDDEDDWRYMATMYLTDAGYEVSTARDSTEALRQAGGAKPDLIILDLNLGGESGLVVMKLLKEKHPGVPVLLYTGMEHDEAAVRAMLRDGAHQYLRKTTMGEMLKAVRKALGELPQQKPAPEEKALQRAAQAFEPDPESILLLEDDAAFGESVQLFLESHSYTVTRVPDGAEGLRQIARTDYDIILCDMVMPSMSGDQFYLAVKRIKPRLCNRLVYMTECLADPQTEEFIRRVRGVMLRRPFPLADLLTAIAIAWTRALKPVAGVL